MKVLYKNPNDFTKYTRWSDNDGIHDIWYEKVTYVFDYKNMDLPSEMVEFLDKWNNKILEYKKSYVEMYPVKLAHIEFIYKDVVYAIYPSTVSATYTTDFMSDEEYEASWDSLFESYQREIRNEMEKELGVKYSRYIGFLD